MTTHLVLGVAGDIYYFDIGVQCQFEASTFALQHAKKLDGGTPIYIMQCGGGNDLVIGLIAVVVAVVDAKCMFAVTQKIASVGMRFYHPPSRCYTSDAVKAWVGVHYLQQQKVQQHTQA